jgi:uncharacterized membrane protein
MDYVTVKWLHVLSSTVLFGTGVGSAYYMLFTSLARDPRPVASVVRLVVIADWMFTATTVVVQPATGVYMTHLAQLPLTTPWVLWSIVLYAVAVACWLPVVWLQIRMHKLAAEAVRLATPLPQRYFRYLQAWTALGVPAFFAFVGVFWLMVAKPSF